MTTQPSTAGTRLSSGAVIPLATLDPAEPLDDLDWLDQAIGEARVVAIGESAHYNREFFQLRHRLTRYLVERHGFSAYAMESGFVEGQLTDDWVRGGEGADHHQLGEVMACGTSSLMGLWSQLGAQLEWMRQHNRAAARPVGFYGIDLPGSMASLLPGLEAVLGYLARVDPEFQVEPGIRETASAFAVASAFSAPAAVAAYAALAPEARDALTAGLAGLAARMAGRRLDYVRCASVDAHERALRSLSITVTLDSMYRAMVRDDRQEMMSNRDVAMADTVEWILRREDRVVLAAHNSHLQRWPAAMPGMPAMTPLGMHLADRLGKDYLVIGTTSASGQTLNVGPDFYTGTLFTAMEAPRSGSLDALMAASHDGPFATDLRRLSPTDAATMRSISRQRAGIGTFYGELSPLDAFDLVVHLPSVSAADPDQAALAHMPHEVREAFAQWSSQASPAAD
ncbi:erythromycin esterase family protein [Kitasatospora kifunensis]|uniref:Erythromycin esterase n=1 Tax=Kitasatospora kifunensis TaxID=58351 RepID=A0A7W7QX06_KITKI|nr:erythromycin esterase family protein [Kitasatospora kifunensis]MBB4921083.1 erythromycin esterase [Kitasatospora kifunensis]